MKRERARKSFIRCGNYKPRINVTCVRSVVDKNFLLFLNVSYLICVRIRAERVRRVVKFRFACNGFEFRIFTEFLGVEFTDQGPRRFAFGGVIIINPSRESREFGR